jgi:wyosine [tRNA(Phe)-imidazoG37] synthetase (radical SAM superfamily)
MSAHVYGPVPSRRLGFSLGVDIVPLKTCSFNCIYCQLGRTKKRTVLRRKFFSSREILSSIREAVHSGRKVDFITFSGSGEPTLNRSIGKLIREIKKLAPIPVAVLTNSSLLSQKFVRKSLLEAEVVIPSLDAATARTFRKVNRPEPSLKIEAIIDGLESFRREFKGQIWLEVMLVKGVNDSPADIEALKKAIARIKPDRVQLNTVVRPPAEKWALPLSRRELEAIKQRLGGRTEVVADFRKKPQPKAVESLDEPVLSLVARRPATVREIAAALGSKEADVRRQLSGLMQRKKIRIVRHKGRDFYETK